jgi:SSS family solute:Na+ symporter
MVSRVASLVVKAGALLTILVFQPQFSIDLQLAGGVLILQTLPAVAIGLFTAWPHRWALVAGLVGGLCVGLALLYGIPQRAPDGTIVRAHFGGSSWPLANLGLDTGQSVYVGIIALAVNLAIVFVGTLVLRFGGVPDGVDRTAPGDYVADEGATTIHRMAELVDGTESRGAHSR